MSTQIQEMMEVSFDELLNAETNCNQQRLNDTNTTTIQETTTTDIDEIDYFGDYTNNSIDNDITNGPLYKPHSCPDTHENGSDLQDTNTVSFDAAYDDYINSTNRYCRSKYHHSYRKRFRRLCDMTMEERDQWEQIAQRNKRRRLNEDASKYTNNALNNINMESNMEALSASDDESSASSSASFEAILFENNEQIDRETLQLSSSEDEEDENKQKQKEAEKQDQIENLIRIPKREQSQRSHLDLIKAVRKCYFMNKILPILEDFAQHQNITKKRAKRAILQVMRENNLDLSMLRRKDEIEPKQLQRQQDDTDDDEDEDEDGDINMDKNDRKQLKLLNLPPDAGKYPFDSAVEKAMLRLLNRLKQFNPLFVDRPSRTISMDVSTMIDKVSMKAYNNVGIDFRYDFELMVSSYRDFYITTLGIVHLCTQLRTFGTMLIQKSDAKLVQRAKNKPMSWHLKQMMKQKRRDSHNNKEKNRKRVFNSDPVDIEGYWKIPYNKIKYRADQSSLERMDDFVYENPFKYSAISQYMCCVALSEMEQTLTMNKLQTDKKGACDGKHCSDLTLLGAYNVHSMQFNTECFDRKHCIECSSLCGCDALECKNRSIQNGMRSVMNVNVMQQLTFGIDQSTRRRITKTCIKECGFALVVINRFIECVLQPSFNSFISDVNTYPHLKSDKIMYKNASLNGDTAPFFMTDVLKMILAKFQDDHAHMQIAADDAEMSTCLLSKICKLANKRDLCYDGDVLDIGGGVAGAFCSEFYPIYPKGNGVICINRNGISHNAFIIEYFGEVYPSWRWYEKCDLQKQVTRAMSSVPQLPDFFNIMLERHDDDPSGYDLLFVDPIARGNFGSRLSHSCSPNTQTVPMVVNGKYVIAIFAIDKIEYGQELTFDYNSVTESEQEYRSAICLCSQFKCRGTYLAYAGSNTYQQILSLYHNTLHRSAAIFRACCDLDNDNDIGTMNDMDSLLKQRHISSSLLDGLPEWGKKWCYLITNFIEFEAAELPKELMKNTCSGVADIESEIYGVKQQRMQNVCVTIDKIKYVLRNQCGGDKQRQAPIRLLTKKEILNRLWNDENSLVNNLLKCLLFHNETPNCNTKYITEIEDKLRNNIYINDYCKLKPNLLFIRDRLRECISSDCCYYNAAADLLHLWINTKWFFAHNNYDSIKSAPFTLDELGFKNNINANIKSLKCQKPYGPLYIWAQMTFWWKQTVEKPDTSLSHCRRGTLYLPFLDCCFAKKLKHPICKVYDEQNRNYWIHTLHESCHSSWSNSLHWTFKQCKGNQKTYGSPFLDHYIDETLNELPRIINELKQWTY